MNTDTSVDPKEKTGTLVKEQKKLLEAQKELKCMQKQLQVLGIDTSGDDTGNAGGAGGGKKRASKARMTQMKGNDAMKRCFVCYSVTTDLKVNVYTEDDKVNTEH